MQRVLIRAAFGLLPALLFVSESRGIPPEVSLAVKLRHWDTDTGLPSPRVFAIAYAPDGYVWMGTYGGLVRFDGIAFTTFTPENVPEISNASITALAVDAQGAIWIGTEGGQLITRTAECFRALPTPWAKPKRINAICPGADGGLWLGTRHGIVTVHGDEHRFFGEADGLEAMDVSHVAIDGAGRPWALCGGIVHVLENDRWQAHRFEGIVDGRVSAITSSVTGGIWCSEMAAELASDGGSRILRVDANGRVERVAGGPWPRTASRSRIDVLLEDAVGRLWCATRGGGTYCREANGEWREVGEETGLARADAVALAADPSGSIWIGTRNTGAFQASPVKVQSFRLPPAASDHVVTTVCARKDGSLWAGTDGSGVIAFHGGTTKQFGLEEGLPSLDIVAVAEGPGRNFYAATPRGLARLEQGRFTRVSLPEMSLTASCHCLFQDKQEQLWAGTSDGVIRIHGTGLELVPVENGRPLDAIGFTQDANGRLIALSRTGQIHAFGNGRFRHLFSATSDPISRMRAIAADAEGSLWLGSYGAGLSCHIGETVRRWSMQENGLPSSHVLAIVAVSDVMWVSSENGVFGCPIDKFKQAPVGPHMMPTWRVTDVEGLPEKVCTAWGQPAACLGPDRRIWVPTGRSVAGFLPAEIVEPLKVFPPQVERIVADGLEMAPGGFGAMSIPAGTVRLEVQFTSPNLVAPQRILYRHRLDGFDQDWVSVGNRRIASYTGLPPGDYRFRVEAADPMGAWRGSEADLPLRIPPRFWQRRSVRTVAACGLAGAIAAVGWAGERLRSKRRLQRLQIERAREQERQRIARDIHDDIGSGLTEIVMLSDIASREADVTADLGTVRRIAERARALTRAMDEVVWAINPRNDSLEGFITYFHRWAQAYLGNAGLRVRWDLPLEPTEAPLGAEVRHQFFMACKEAIANLVKHASASEVRIRCHADSGGWEILITDDGVGFVVDESPADGDGLVNLRTRLADVGGHCDIRSAPGRGTTVRFFIPTKAFSGNTNQG